MDGIRECMVYGWMPHARMGFECPWHRQYSIRQVATLVTRTVSGDWASGYISHACSAVRMHHLNELILLCMFFF